MRLLVSVTKGPEPRDHGMSVTVASFDLLCILVQGPHEVQDLHHVEPAEGDAAAPRAVAINGVTQAVRNGSARPSHEVIEEVIHQLDNIHDGL